jgi:hypothetical protein
MTKTIILPIILFASACWPSPSFGQQASFEDLIASESAAPQPLPIESKRILGIIPNNRTWPSLTDYKPLSTREKFEIARQDSFDRGTVILAAAFAADAESPTLIPRSGKVGEDTPATLAHLTGISSSATTCPRRSTRPYFIKIPAILDVALGPHGLGWGIP